jgi:hypothetical protein
MQNFKILHKRGKNKNFHCIIEPALTTSSTKDNAHILRPAIVQQKD